MTASTYEYKAIASPSMFRDLDGGSGLEALLNDAARDGWELASAVPTVDPAHWGAGTIILRRPVDSLVENLVLKAGGSEPVVAAGPYAEQALDDAVAVAAVKGWQVVSAAIDQATGDHYVYLTRSTRQ